MYTLLTGEKSGYYQDFGRLEQLAKGFREGFIFSGEYSPYRQRRHGSSSRGLPEHRFIVFAQNHDQVGNRLLGERLSQLASFEALKLAAGTVLLSPFIPLLFMGEEYGEVAPFQFFISHSDPELVEAVRRGRREEFNAFRWQAEPLDPQSEETFERSKLDRDLRQSGSHRVLWEFYRELLRLRREVMPVSGLNPIDQEVYPYAKEKVLAIRRAGEGQEVAMAFNFGEEPASPAWPWPQANWDKCLDSAETKWHGPGSPAPAVIQAEGGISLPMAAHSVVLFVRREEEP